MSWKPEKHSKYFEITLRIKVVDKTTKNIHEIQDAVKNAVNRVAKRYDFKDWIFTFGPTMDKDDIAEFEHDLEFLKEVDTA